MSATTIGADIYTVRRPAEGRHPGPGPRRRRVPAADPGPPDATGPGAEVGWLAGNKRIIQLSVHLAPGTADDKSAELLPKLVDLAKLIDLSSL